MKRFSLFPLLYVLVSCNTNAVNTQSLEQRIDSLEKKLAASYKPGLGEFMSSIQVHHAKLWFAGQAQNWQLADFEVAEIKEALDNIPIYCAGRKEINKLDMINPALDSISKSIRTERPALFKNSFEMLTSNCNNCHQATQHAFNVIKIPVQAPFSNQDFTNPAK